MASGGDPPGFLDLPGEILKSVVSHLRWSDKSRAAASSRQLEAAVTSARGAAWVGATHKGGPPQDSAERAELLRGLAARLSPPCQPDVALLFATEGWAPHIRQASRAVLGGLPDSVCFFGTCTRGVVGTDTTTGETMEADLGEGLACALVCLPAGVRAQSFAASGDEVHAAWGRLPLARAPGHEGEPEPRFFEEPLPSGAEPVHLHAMVVGDCPASVETVGLLLQHDFPRASRTVVGGVTGCEGPALVARRAAEPGPRNARPPAPLEVAGAGDGGCVALVLWSEGGAGAPAAAPLALPLVTRGVQPVGPVYDVQLGDGGGESAVWLASARHKGEGEPWQPMICAVRDAEEYADGQGGLVMGVRAPGEGRFHMCPPETVHRATGAVSVRWPGGDLAELLGGGEAEVQFHGMSAAGSDREVREHAPAMRAGLHPASPLGAVVFSCCARGARYHGKPGRETAAAREALGGAPVIGGFMDGEYGPCPIGEGMGHNTAQSSLMGFTGCYGVLYRYEALRDKLRHKRGAIAAAGEGEAAAPRQPAEAA